MIILTFKKESVLRKLFVIAVMSLLAIAITTSLSLDSLGEDRGVVGKKHSIALLEEAQLRDLTGQIDRGMIYAKQAGIQVERAEKALKTIDLVLKDADASLRMEKRTAASERNYESICDTLKRGQEVARQTLKLLIDSFEEKFPWFSPHVFENESAAQSKRCTLGTGPIHRYFCGTRLPGRLDAKEMNEILRSLEPFRFDFLEYGYKPKKINRQEGNYHWKALDTGVTLLDKYGYAMSLAVNFGSMKAWPLMKKFSWIPRKYPESAIEEMLFQNDKGQTLWRSGFHSVLNIWHPVIIRYQEDWLRALGKHCQNRNIAIYELFNEMALSTKKRPVGYSKYGQTAFHEYLTKKYRNAETLNKRLGTSFTNVGAVKPPSKGSYQKGDLPIGVIYEFERFRKESLVNYMKEMIAELRIADGNPGHAISSQLTGWFNDAHNPKMSARDFLKLASLDWDLYGVHCAGDGRFPAITLLYHYCINRYAKKIYWNDEFWWDYREAADQNIDDEIVLRAVAERNIWRHIAYGIKGFNIFPGLYSSRPGGLWTKAGLIRYETGAFPLVITKINKYADIFFGGHILNQKVGILQPTTTLDITASEFSANENAMKLSDWMLSEHIIPFYIPEECVIDGRENIAEFRVLISPYAPFVPESLSEKIEKWVKDGGIFVSIGNFGKFDQHGREQGNFVRTVFENEDTRTILSRRYGKGKLIGAKKKITHTDYVRHIRPELEPLRIVSCDVKPQILELPARKERFTGERNFYARNDLDLIPWEDDEGRKYLFVINLNPFRKVATKIKIRGEFGQVIDLAIDGGLPVPVVSQSGCTEFSTALEPGQGVIYRLD